MNKVILIGRLTRAPELRTTPTNLSVAMFSLAVSRPYNPNAQQQEADFINCVVWRKQAENLAKYCHKGSQVAVEGRMQTRNYVGQDGNKKYITEVMCDSITYLGNSSSAENRQEPADYQQKVESAVNTMVNQEDPFESYANENDIDYPFDN